MTKVRNLTDFRKVVTELLIEMPYSEIAKLAGCRQKTVEAIAAGREPSYHVGDRLARMYDSLKDSRGGR